VAQQVPERLGAARLHEPDRALDGSDLHDVTHGDLQVLATIDRDQCLVRIATTERIADRYAAIGVTIRLRLTGSTIGPPAENE
jgi:hypothetical protein